MTWQAYRLTFELLAPLCIGDRSIGNLRKCKHYAPSITMWGAATASLTKHLWDQVPGKTAMKYDFVGKYLQKNVRFGYFFVMENKIVYYPQYKKDVGLCFGGNENSKSANDFEHGFIQTVGMTAIDTGSFGAQDNTLHEMEFIGAFSKNHHKRFLTGNVYIRDDAENSSWIDINNQDSPLRQSLNTLWLGGSRSNGFGKVQLKADTIKSNEDEIVPGWKLGTDPDNLSFELSDDCAPLMAYCHLAGNESINNFQGDLDVISGYLQNLDGRTKKIIMLVAVPGSILGKPGNYLMGGNGMLAFKGRFSPTF